MKHLLLFTCFFYLSLFSTIKNNQFFLSNFAFSEIIVGKNKFLNMKEQLVIRENTFYEMFPLNYGSHILYHRELQIDQISQLSTVETMWPFVKLLFKCSLRNKA